MATQVVKSVGSAGGRDYSTITAAIAAIPADLVAADQQWVLELYADSEFTERIIVPSKTTDATRNIVVRCAAGQSFNDSGSRLSNALRYNAANGVAFNLPSVAGEQCVKVSAPFTLLSGLQLKATGSTHNELLELLATDCTFKNSIVENLDTVVSINRSTCKSEQARSGFVNVLLVVDGGNIRGGFGVGVDSSYAVNCGAVHYGAGSNGRRAFDRGYGVPLIRNCYSVGFDAFGKDTTAAAGSGYNATTLASGNTPGTNNVYSIVEADNFESVVFATRDFRLKATAPIRNVGTRDQTYTADLDILKSARSTTTPAIGPHEYVAGGGGGGGGGSSGPPRITGRQMTGGFFDLSGGTA